MILETQTRLQYKLLKHEGFWSRVGCQDKQSNEKKKPWKEDLIYGIDNILKWARPLAGRYNLYISRNPRDKDGKVSGVPCFSVDADPVRDSETAALPEQHERAISVAKRIVAEQGEGIIASSGNGALILFPFPELVTEDIDAFLRSASDFERQIKRLYSNPEVTIDATQYGNAMVKLIGALSTKGDRRYWRPARFLSNPALAKFGTGILNRIRSVGVSVPTDNPQVGGAVLPGGRPDDAVDAPSTKLSPSERLKLAEQSLGRLSAERRDSYQEWLKVGIALKEFGDAGLRLWDEWSSLSPKYQRGDCEAKWRTFRADQQLTVGSLKYWADQDSPALGVAGNLSGVSAGAALSGVRPLLGSRAPAVWTPAGEDGGLKPLTQRDHKAGAVTTTGFNELDRRIGGYRPGYVYGILAPTNVGKSTFVVQAANQLCRDGKRVLLVITEMDVREAVLRFAATETSIRAADIQSASLDSRQRDELRSFETRFKQYPLAVHYTVSPNQAAIEQLIQEQKPDAVLWDYFQHFETGTDSRQVQLASLARWYESMALKYQIPFIVAAQLHRRVDFKTGKYQPSTMDSIKDCKVLNDAAKCVLTLNWSQDEQASEDGPVNVEVNIEKNKGPQAKFHLLLDRRIPRFQNI